jgi:hypothetical protein
MVLAFTIPMLAWSFNSTFKNEPIQANPTFGQGERFVGNTSVQIIIPPAVNENVSPAPELPGQKLPDATVVLPEPLQIQPSQVSK